MSTQHHPSHSLVKLFGWGAASLAAYAMLFLYEKQLLDWSSRGRWFFILPILIAFTFSFVHGHFTAEFWESLGFQAKK